MSNHSNNTTHFNYSTQCQWGTPKNRVCFTSFLFQLSYAVFGNSHISFSVTAVTILKEKMLIRTHREIASQNVMPMPHEFDMLKELQPLCFVDAIFQDAWSTCGWGHVEEGFEASCPTFCVTLSPNSSRPTKHRTLRDNYNSLMLLGWFEHQWCTAEI